MVSLLSPAQTCSQAIARQPAGFLPWHTWHAAAARRLPTKRKRHDRTSGGKGHHVINQLAPLQTASCHVTWSMFWLMQHMNTFMSQIQCSPCPHDRRIASQVQTSVQVQVVRHMLAGVVVARTCRIAAQAVRLMKRSLTFSWLPDMWMRMNATVRKYVSILWRFQPFFKNLLTSTKRMRNQLCLQCHWQCQGSPPAIVNNPLCIRKAAWDSIQPVYIHPGLHVYFASKQ